MNTRIPLGSLLRAPSRRPSAEFEYQIVRLPDAGAARADDDANAPQAPAESAVKDGGHPAPAEPVAPVAAPESDVTSLRKLLLGSLPEHYERQIERLEQKIIEGVADVHVALSALEQRLEKRIVAADVGSRTSTGQLRQQLLEEMRGANDAIQSYHAEAMRRLESGLQEMQSSKLDQATFSKFLEGLARYLGRDDAARTNAQEAR
jgi:hypothetical protein